MHAIIDLLLNSSELSIIHVINKIQVTCMRYKRNKINSRLARARVTRGIYKSYMRLYCTSIVYKFMRSALKLFM